MFMRNYQTVFQSGDTISVYQQNMRVCVYTCMNMYVCVCMLTYTQGCWGVCGILSVLGIVRSLGIRYSRARMLLILFTVEVLVLGILHRSGRPAINICWTNVKLVRNIKLQKAERYFFHNDVWLYLHKTRDFVFIF